MNSFEFHFHQVLVHIEAESRNLSNLVEQFCQDFKAFPLTEPSSTPRARLYFYLSSVVEPSARPRLPFVLSRNGKSIYGFGNRRICLVKDVVARCWSEGNSRYFRIEGDNLENIREVAYLAVLSALGEELDGLGLHRTHALAAQFNGENFLLMAESGLGKSSLAGLLLRKEQSLRLFSDEAPLLKRGQLYPYPLRLALDENVAEALDFPSEMAHNFVTKKLFSFPLNRQAQPGKLDCVFIARRATGLGRIQHKSRWLLMNDIFLNLVVGVGQVQMAEWMLRTSAVPRLMRSALGRFAAFARLMCSSSSFYQFDMVEDANENVQILRNFLKARPEPAPRHRKLNHGYN